MCDGHRPTCLDLFEKMRHDAAVTTQYISESDCHEVRLAGTSHVLNDQLRHPFCRAHDAGGAHGLVGRDHNEAFDIVLLRQGRHRAGAQHVVLHSLTGVVFHHGNVLVRGGMEDDLRCIRLHRRLQPFPVRDVADHGVNMRTSLALCQLVVNRKQAVFVSLIEDEAFGRIGNNLPTQLRSDGAARPRHQNTFTLQ